MAIDDELYRKAHTLNIASALAQNKAAQTKPDGHYLFSNGGAQATLEHEAIGIDKG